MTLSSNNLSVSTLRTVEPWANRLAEKKKAGYEIVSERVEDPLTEAHILLRKIARVVFMETFVMPPDMKLRPVCFENAHKDPPIPPPLPLSAREKVEINQRLADSHVRSMALAKSIWRQLSVLNENSLVVSGQPQNVAYHYEQMLSPSN